MMPDEIEKMVREWVGEVINQDPGEIDLNKKFDREMGLSDREVVKIIAHVEYKNGCYFNLEDAVNIFSGQDIVNLMRRMTSQ